MKAGAGSALASAVCNWLLALFRLLGAARSVTVRGPMGPKVTESARRELVMAGNTVRSPERSALIRNESGRDQAQFAGCRGIGGGGAKRDRQSRHACENDQRVLVMRDAALGKFGGERQRRCEAGLQCGGNGGGATVCRYGAQRNRSGGQGADGDAHFARGAGQRDGSRESSRPQASELLRSLPMPGVVPAQCSGRRGSGDARHRAPPRRRQLRRQSLAISVPDHAG